MEEYGCAINAPWRALELVIELPDEVADRLEERAVEAGATVEEAVASVIMSILADGRKRRRVWASSAGPRLSQADRRRPDSGGGFRYSWIEARQAVAYRRFRHVRAVKTDDARQECAKVVVLADNQLLDRAVLVLGERGSAA